MSVTLRFQSTGTVPGNSSPVVMQGANMTIGRGDENDVVLPDPDRMVSKSHCVIENHNGNVVVVDLSTNGTFLNYGKVPLGRTATPLNNGDVLTLGSYELAVEIRDRDAESAAIIASPVDLGPASHGIATNAPSPMDLLDEVGPEGDFLDDLLGGEGGPKGPGQVQRDSEDPFDSLLPPLGEEAQVFDNPPPAPEAQHDVYQNTSASDAFAVPSASGGVIPDDWEDDLLGGTPSGPAAFDQVPARPSPKPTPAHATPPPVAPPKPEPLLLQPSVDAEPAAEPVQPEPIITPSSDSAPGPKSQGDQAAARAFLQVLGAEDVKISDDELSGTMLRLGSVLKSMITGLREILMTRTSIKSEFRIDQTMINAGGNNPLKFSISPEQAIEAMVKPRTKGYLSAQEATDQALKDIKAHEVAMVTGMEAALKGVLKRLDPEKLGEKIETGGGLSGLLKGKKARYWEVYEKMYAEVSDQAENDFHELFSKEFSRAYQDQLEKLK